MGGGGGGPPPPPGAGVLELYGFRGIKGFSVGLVYAVW